MIKTWEARYEESLSSSDSIVSSAMMKAIEQSAMQAEIDELRKENEELRVVAALVSLVAQLQA